MNGERELERGGGIEVHPLFLSKGIKKNIILVQCFLSRKIITMKLS